MRVTIFTLACVMAVSVAFAGSLDSAADPDLKDFYILKDIYKRKRVCGTESVSQSTFTEAAAGPAAGTRYPLNRMMRAGDDGALGKGVAWSAATRFTDNGDGTVTDKLTGLIWLKNAKCFGVKNWFDALAEAAGLASGTCGLSDGSSAGDWRLPSVRELSGLYGFFQSGRALYSYPFANVQSDYWSSMSDVYDIYNPSYALLVSLDCGFVAPYGKLYVSDVWPVRDGR